MAVGKYNTHVQPKLLLIEAWARDGLTDEDIYKNLGISHDSFYKYKKEHAEFSESLKRGKEEIDIIVENSLLKRAIGYEYEEITQEPLYHPLSGEPLLNIDGTRVIVTTKIMKKQVAPDTTAQIFWLKNRKKEAWRDKQELEHSGETTHTVKYEDQLNELLKGGSDG